MANRKKRTALVAYCNRCLGAVCWASPVLGPQQLDKDKEDWLRRGYEVLDRPADELVDVLGHAASCPRRNERCRE